MAKNKIGANIVLEGEAEYRKALKNINAEQRELRSEMKLCSSTYDGQQNSIAALTKKGEILSRQYEAQAKKVEIYSKAVAEAAKNQEEAGNKVEGLKADLEAANRKMEEMSASTDTSNEALEEQQKIIEELKNKLALAEDSYSRAQTMTNNWQSSLNEAQAGLNDLSHEIQSNDQYLDEARNSMDGCADSIDEYGNEIEEAQEQTSTFADVLKAELVGDAIKKGIGMVVDGLKNITSTAISMGKSFEASMSNVAATMGITADEIRTGSAAYETLEKAAKDCGKSTKYSASEAADALNYLALAGYDAEKAAKTLPSVLDLAAAGGMELGAASDLVTDSMAALGMETSELNNYIDEMARTSQKSNTSVAQLGEATLVCAGMASTTGQSLETLNAELGVLANNGIKGAEGGTHMRNILQSLVAPTDKAKDAMRQLGLQVADESGDMRDLNDIMIDLNEALAGMSGNAERARYLNKIFNSRDLGSVNALLKGTGMEFNNLKNELLNCDGAAKDMAETMGDNLEGRITILNSALEGLGITGYEKIEGMLKQSVEAATDSVGRLQDSMENGRLGDAMDDMAAALGEAAEKAIGFGEDALPVLIDGLAWIIENSDVIISGIAGITAANIAHGKVIPLINAVTKAWNNYRIANEGATVAQWALNAAKSAFSAEGLVTAITAVTVALATYIALSDNAYKETKRFIDNAEASIDTFNANAQARKDSVSESKAESEIVRQLTAELEELNSQEVLSVEQKSRLKMVVDQLNTVMPELNLTIDEQTGKLKQSNEEIEKYVENLQRRQEQAAYEDRLQQITADMLEAKELFKETEEAYDNFMENLHNPEKWYQTDFGDVFGFMTPSELAQQDKLNKIMEESGQIAADLEAEYADLNAEYEEFLKVENDLIDGTRDLNRVMVEYKGTTYAVTQEVAARLDELDAAYGEAYEEAEKSLRGQIGLFEELEVKSDLTVAQMADNMQKQAEIMTTYNEDLQKAMELAKEGVLDNGLLVAIEQMGIDGAAYLHEIVKAAETESDDFVRLMEAWADNVDSIDLLSGTRAEIETGCSEIKEMLLEGTSDAVESMNAKLSQSFADMAVSALNEGKAIGANTAEGVKIGLNQKQQDVVSSASNFAFSMYNSMRKVLKINSPSRMTKYLGEMSGEGFNEGLIEVLEEGIEAVHEAMDGMLDYDCGPVLDGQGIVMESVDDLTAAYAAQSWVLNEAGNAMLDYAIAGVEMGDSVESTAERVEKLTELYADAKEEAEQSIDSQVKLFEKLEMKSDITIKDMIESLRSQTAYFIEYGADLNKASELVQQGLLDRGLLGAIQKMGLDGAGYLHELVTAAQEDTTAFTTVMNEWAVMTMTKENLSASMAGISMLYGAKMDEVAEIQKIKGEEIESQVSAAAANTSKTVSDSLSSMVSSTSDNMDNMAEVVSKKTPEVEKTVTDLCSVSVEGFQSSLDIDAQGKSKKFATVGYSIPQGIAEGIYDGQDLVINAVRDVIENAISAIAFDGLSDTIVRKINEELGGLID